MEERAHPQIDGFKRKIRLIWRKWTFPTIHIYPTPYSKAFYWRYSWAKRFCKNKNVLEIPCGMGWGTSLLSNARKVVGVDISSEAIREAALRYSGRNRKFIIGDMQKLMFQQAEFDLVVCLEGIEHVSIETGIQFVREANRVLKQNGILLLSSPLHRTKEHSGNPYHVKEYKLNELIEILDPFFYVNSIRRKEVEDLNVYFIEARKK